MPPSKSTSITAARAQERGGVQSVEIGLRVLLALVDAGGEQTLGRIAEGAGMAPAKAHRYLASLMRAGFVERSDVGQRYVLGGGALRVGLAALARVDLLEVARRELEQLRDTIEATLLVAVWGTHGPTIVRWIESTRPVTVNVRVGSTMPLLRSATGRVFAAYLPEALTAPLIAAERARSREETGNAVDLPSLAQQHAQIRTIGLGTVSGDMLAGVLALAAPVFDHEDRLVAVVTALGPSGYFDDAIDGATAGALRDAADRISDRLGHRRTRARP